MWMSWTRQQAHWACWALFHNLHNLPSSMHLILAKLYYLIELVCFLWVISYPENTIVDIFSSLVNTLCYLCHIFFSHSIRVCLLISFLVMRWSTSFFSFNIISFMHIALQYGILVLNTIKPFFLGSYNHVSPCMYFFTYITSLISIPSDLSSNFFLTIKKKKKTRV